MLKHSVFLKVPNSNFTIIEEVYNIDYSAANIVKKIQIYTYFNFILVRKVAVMPIIYN